MRSLMASYRPRFAGRPTSPRVENVNGQKEAYPQGQSIARPEKYDVVSGPAPMKTTNAFHNRPSAIPQVGLHLGFNK
jgi:hypothetical protein